MPNPAAISGRALGDGTLAGRSSQSLGAAPETTPADTAERAVETYLRGLIARCDDPPLIGELTAADLGTPRATASIARAALCWYIESRPEQVAERLRGELAEHDLLIRLRVRQAGLDVHGRGSTDWSRVHEVTQARAEYRRRWGVPA